MLKALYLETKIIYTKYLKKKIGLYGMLVYARNAVSWGAKFLEIKKKNKCHTINEAT